MFHSEDNLSPSSADELEPAYPLIREGLKAGRVIPFLGAGASQAHRPAGSEWQRGCEFLPNASELATDLNRLTGFPPTEQAELTRVAQYLDGIAGRPELDEQLHQIFAKAYQPGKLHDAIVELGCKLIVTVNYDDLVEQAFARRGLSCRVVVYTSDASPSAGSGSPHNAVSAARGRGFTVWEPGADRPEFVPASEMDLKIDDVPTIYKMHGAVDRQDQERDSYVITEDDYVEFLTRMSDSTAIPKPLWEPFRKSHFLFLGYSLRDWNLRVVLRRIWREWPHSRMSWAIQQHASPLEREFWRHRHIVIYQMSIADFLVRLNGC